VLSFILLLFSQNKTIVLAKSDHYRDLRLPFLLLFVVSDLES